VIPRSGCRTPSAFRGVRVLNGGRIVFSSASPDYELNITQLKYRRKRRRRQVESPRILKCCKHPRLLGLALHFRNVVDGQVSCYAEATSSSAGMYVTKWLQFVRACSAFLLLVGAMFLLDGTWCSYRQYVESTRWAPVEARVVRCSISGSWHYAGTPSSRNIMGDTSYVRCIFAYETGGLPRESTMNVGNTVFSSPWRKPFGRAVTVAGMHAWIARHPSGSVLTVHYDSSDANRISIVGADGELRTDSPKDRLQIGILSASFGIVLFAVTRLARKRLAISASASMNG
jgi:hypothetical protein